MIKKIETFETYNGTLHINLQDAIDEEKKYIIQKKGKDYFSTRTVLEKFEAEIITSYIVNYFDEIKDFICEIEKDIIQMKGDLLNNLRGNKNENDIT